LSTVWNFSTLLIISTYTANLAAFLTAASMEKQIENVEELSRQSKIKYGATAGGSTLNFFKVEKCL
jgi:hypothetical protein